MVHTMTQAVRDGLTVTHYVTRHQRKLAIPVSLIAGTPLERYIRRDSSSGEPLADEITQYPDADIRLRRPDGSVVQIFDEIDGGTETLLSGTDIDAIEKKVRFYTAYAAYTRSTFTVRFLTYRPNSFERMRNIADTIRLILGDSPAPRFRLGTLDRFLTANGALTRGCVFVDYLQRPIECVPMPRQSIAGEK